ncbi:PWWP domain-containing DNA repair factor 3A [Rhineura floridana]|uniref:PWWP domain-containing DNA repair factor 3A n=1 Tax=Rhineura floridana TaxID=261503 RepID=UPI002AC86D00|nr:PWWP domain-containing DNA repair factor 3A [Rhineura floridana]
MTEAEYVLCKWKKHFWPAKVLSRSRRRSPDKLATLRVQIMCENKQVNVRCANIKPLNEENINSIASQLDQSQRRKSRNAVEELIYRRALREALNILRRGVPRKGGSPSKGRKGKTSAQNDPQVGDLPSFTASWQRPLSQKGLQEVESGEETSESNPLVQVAVTEGEHLLSSKGSPSSKRSSSKLPHLSGTREAAGAFSEVEMPVTPPEEQKLLSQPGADAKSLCSLKEAEGRHHQVRGKSGRESSFPLPARASTPAPASRKSCPRLTPPGRRLGMKPTLRRSLLGCPVECISTKLARGLSEEGGTPPRKYIKASNGSRYSEGLEGTRQKRTCAASCLSQERQGRTRREDSKSGPSPDGFVLEGQEEENQSTRVNVNQFQLQDSEDEEGLEPPSSVQLSPVGADNPSPGSRDDEDEELPSILLHQEPCSIEAGMLVWCKLPRYPYWPAVVKRVQRKAKKANVVIIEKCVEDKKAKGFSTSLRNLKHFDCEEKQTLIEKAREDHSLEITWCINLIADYRIRVGCHSFMGSFLEYCVDDMSYPVRREVLPDLSQMTFPKTEETDLSESLSEATPTKPLRKVLPDRTRAARDKANARIVEFIVKAKGADEHLRSILRSKKPSHWLREFFAARPYLTCTETYLEDDAQQDLVLSYLHGVYQEVSAGLLPEINGDKIKFVLDVLFPEAIIYAISAVDHIDYKKAEEKYMRGPLVSRREREIFEEEILEKKRKWNLQSKRPSLEASQ